MALVRVLLLLSLFGGLAPDTSIHARKARPVPCEPGTFGLSASVQTQVETALGGAPIDRITIGPGRAVSMGACRSAGKVVARRTRTVVTASWKTCGVRRRVRLAASLSSPACDTLTATIRGRGFKAVRVTGRRLEPSTTPTTTTTTTTSGGTTTTTTTGSTTTTTTLPGSARCGNGTVEAGETCEGLVGCAADQVCAATCTCAARPHGPITSQELIADALAAGTIDHPTSLLYRTWALFNDSRLPPEYDGEANAGEDLDLFGEIVAALGALGAAWQAALEPFVVRPTEPTSYFSAPPADVAPLGAGNEDGAPEAAAAAAPKCPIDPTTGKPDWRASETPHFVVWACAHNDPTDPTAAQRIATGVVAEQLWAKMTPELGPFKGDAHPAGPPPQSRIDVYLLDVEECRERDNVCLPVPRGSALAVAHPAGPCDSAAGGAHTSSGYVMFPLESVPDAPPGVDDSSLFRAVLAHELFHLFQYKSNLRGMGRRCRDASTIPRFASTWLTESHAEWASWAFVPDDAPSNRTLLFDAFQQHRPPATTSLESLARKAHPYQAFIYHSFRQQEAGGSRAPMIDLWTQSPGATTPDDLERFLDALFPFGEHFRDFAVRNVNPGAGEFTPGDPVTPLHADQDPAIERGFGPLLGVTRFFVDADVDDVARPVDLAPLAAQYERHEVSPDARYVKLDFSDVPNGVALDLDVLARVQGEWKRIRVDGSVFEFCRDDPTEDIDEYVLVVSNHDRTPGGQAKGHYHLSTERTCPARWSGTIEHVCTDDLVQAFSEPGQSTQEERHEIARHRWTIVGQGRGPRPGIPPGSEPDVDFLDVAWNGTLTVSISLRMQHDACVGQPSIQTSGGTGTATGRTRVDLIETDAGIVPNPEVLEQSVRAALVGSTELCSGQSGTTMGEQVSFGSLPIVVFSVPELQLLTPEPDGSITVAGSMTLQHLVEPRPGGQRVIECEASWNVRRRLAGL